MQKPVAGAEKLRVLILAPTGQDALLIQRVLTNAGISGMICHSLGELTDMLSSGAGAVLLAQEALQGKHLEAFVGTLQRQPPWSDLPITLLTLKSPVDVSYLADWAIVLRFYEDAGEIRKAITMLKKRTGPHETAIREFQIDSDGIRIGQPLSHLQGILADGAPKLID